MGIAVQAQIKNPFAAVLSDTVPQAMKFDVIHFNSDGDVMIGTKDINSTPVKFSSVTGGEVVVTGMVIFATGTTATDLTLGTL